MYQNLMLCLNIITADWSEIMVRSMWQVLGNDKETGLQFLNCHQKNKTVLNSVTINFFGKKKKKKKEEENPKQSDYTLGLALIPMTTYNDCD